MATNLIQLGNFVLNSSAKSTFKLECDQFIEDNIDGLVALIRQMAGPFSAVSGVPRGGLRLMKALQPFVSLDGPHLLVDDVLTTGGSMERMRDTILAISGVTVVERPHFVKGVVVFARGQCPYWISAVFQMPECFWLKSLARG